MKGCGSGHRIQGTQRVEIAIDAIQAPKAANTIIIEDHMGGLGLHDLEGIRQNVVEVLGLGLIPIDWVMTGS